VKRLLQLAVLVCPIFVATPGTTHDTVSARARAIHDSAIVIDTHEDTPQRFLDENYDIGSTDPRDLDFISLDKARSGNLGALFFSICVDGKTGQAKRAFDLIDSVYDQAAHHPDRLTMSFSADDIERAHREHKLAALIGIEGGDSIENDVRLLRNFYRLGARYRTLTHISTTDWADSSADINNPAVAHHNGLTDFGKQAVIEMNRLGLMVDVSHVSDKTFWDVIAVTKAPIIASHSSARALLDSPRNLSDDMLRAVAKNGGVVNVAFPGNFLDEGFNQRAYSQHQQLLVAVRDYNAKRQASGRPVTPEDTERFGLEWLAKNPIPRPPLKSLIDHIDHVAKIAGVDHVGLGSDFDGANFFPRGMDSAADLPKITEALLDRGYSPDDIKKILDGNMLRVFRDVEQASRRLEARSLETGGREAPTTPHAGFN
jgi:membrane dipeptidase